MRKQGKWVRGAAPGQRLAREFDEISVAREVRESAPQFFGTDGCGNIAPPQRHIKVGMLATEKLHAKQTGDAAGAEGPQEQGLVTCIEANNDEGGYAGNRPNVALPKREKIVALILGSEAVGLLHVHPVGVRG